MTACAARRAAPRRARRRSGRWPGRYCSTPMPCACRRMPRSCEALLHLRVDQRLGHLLVDQLGRARRRLARAAPSAPACLRTSPSRVARSARSSSTVSNSEASFGPLVGELGEHLLLDLLDQRPGSAIGSSSGSGCGGVELEDVAGLGAPELSSSSGTIAAAADLVEVVVGGEAGRAARRLRCPRCRSVTWSPSTRGPVDRLELAELVAQAVDLRVDLLVGRPRAAGSSTRRPP